MAPLLVDVRTAAEMLATSEWSVRRYIDDGKLTIVRLPSGDNPDERSRRVLLAVEDLKQFIDAHKETR